MADWSPTIANEFIRRGRANGIIEMTQMQLQKLVYIAHGWSLAINGERLTVDDPQAWDYGPVYQQLRQALRQYGSLPVAREIRYADYNVGAFSDDPSAPARATLTLDQINIIDRVFRDYGRFHAFRLSALTHKPGTPWSSVYKNGEGKFDEIPSDLIKEHFVELATGTAHANA